MLHLLPVGTVLLLPPDPFTAPTEVPHPGSNQGLGIQLLLWLLGASAWSKHTSYEPAASLSSHSCIIFSKLAPTPTENKELMDLCLRPSQPPFQSLLLHVLLQKKSLAPWFVVPILAAPAWDPGECGNLDPRGPLGPSSRALPGQDKDRGGVIPTPGTAARNRVLFRAALDRRTQPPGFVGMAGAPHAT